MLGVDRSQFTVRDLVFAAPASACLVQAGVQRFRVIDGANNDVTPAQACPTVRRAGIHELGPV